VSNSGKLATKEKVQAAIVVATSGVKPILCWGDMEELKALHDAFKSKQRSNVADDLVKANASTYLYLS